MKKYRLYQIDFYKYAIEVFIDNKFFVIRLDDEQTEVFLDILHKLDFKRDFKGE